MKQITLTKRMIAILMSVIMVLGMTPMIAFASENFPGKPSGMSVSGSTIEELDGEEIWLCPGKNGSIKRIETGSGYVIYEAVPNGGYAFSHWATCCVNDDLFGSFQKTNVYDTDLMKYGFSVSNSASTAYKEEDDKIRVNTTGWDVEYFYLYAVFVLENSVYIQVDGDGSDYFIVKNLSNYYQGEDGYYDYEQLCDASGSANFTAKSGIEMQVDVRLKEFGKVEQLLIDGKDETENVVLLSNWARFYVNPVKSNHNIRIITSRDIPEYTITFHGNGGTTTDGSDTYTQKYGHYDSPTLKENLFSQDYRSFAGWSIGQDISDISYTDQQTFDYKGNIDLYAVWTDNWVCDIEKTDTNGSVDTYTVTYIDGTTSTFTVTNGAKGEQGEQGIQGIQGEKGDDGHTPVITIQNGYWYVDGVNTNVRAEGLKGDTGNGISAIEKTGTNGLVDTYTITHTDGSTSTFTVTNGAKGEQGEQGIQGIQGEPGADGHTPVITIQNGYWYIDNVNTNIRAEGLKGDTGNGISAIEKTGTNGLVDTYTITFTDGWITTFTVTNGADGTDGAAGVGIEKVEKTGSEGNVDTYTITLTNGNTFTFTVTNGNSGSDGTNGKDGITPQLRINESTNMWEVSYDNGKTWTSLGVKATGENGKDGADGEKGEKGDTGENGADGKDGLTPFIGENGNWWIGDTDTGVQAAYDGSVPAGSSSVVENNGMNTATLIAIIIACLALASNIILVILYVNQKKKIGVK